jgi:hypothetical protein
MLALLASDHMLQVWVAGMDWWYERRFTVYFMS